MRRRESNLVLGAAAVWPLGSSAQQNNVWRIAYLHPGFLDSKGDAALFAAFRAAIEHSRLY
jgi:hypothetical protein